MHLIKEKFEAGEGIPFWMSVHIRDRMERGLPPPWDPDGDESRDESRGPH